MSTRAEPPFERFRYWQGQLVRSRDFADQATEVARQARWHNRSVHNAFGVRFGFDAALVDAAPELRVRIGCGVAFECSGAMLVLQRPRELPVPTTEPASSMVLLVRSRDGNGGCGGHAATAPADGGHLWEDDLVFTWERRFRGNPEAGVPLARVSLAAPGSATVDQSVRPLARPLARPRLVSGATIPGLTPWEPWPAGMQTRIDTSAAGFTQVPRYFATLIATRKGPSSPEAPLLSFTHVADAGLTEFTFRILMRAQRRGELEAGGQGRSELQMTEIVRNLGLFVCWIGCQPLEFVPPACRGQRAAPPACTESGHLAG
jgi:hypothetical protein